MRKYKTYSFNTVSDSGFEFDIIMTEDDILNSDWGRNYFLTAPHPTKEECIKIWIEIFMATEIPHEV